TGFGVIAAGIALVFNSCVTEVPDAPPDTTIPFDPAKVLSIAQVKQMLVDSGGIYTFTDNYSLFGVVVMDEKSGNIYESSFIQDSTGGIQLNFIYTSGMYLGDSVRILLNGGTVELYHGLYEIQNLDPGKSVFKIKTDVFYEPKTVTIEELNTNIDTYQCTLIKLDSVQFTDSEMGKTYADSAHFIDENHTLEDCNGNQLIIRSSGYANFANTLLPQGNGSLIAIASLYDSDVQLVIRETSEVLLTNLRCDGGTGNIKFFEGFDTGLGAWENISVVGNQVWEYSTSYGNPEPGVTISGYDGSYNANDDWLISPSLDLSDLPTAFLSIETARNYNGNVLQVKISTDYDGSGNPDNGTWTDLQITLSPGNNGWEWIPSGKVDISEHIGANVHIGFRYTSTNSACATWELDNVKVSEN
ncbi:MAG: DUF5017 domain-containing protein, partial [Bacteroidetes bacterium]|nr:DUF5017 domain-containing protein [Bacteroidota bacterium]